MLIDALRQMKDVKQRYMLFSQFRKRSGSKEQRQVLSG